MKKSLLLFLSVLIILLGACTLGEDTFNVRFNTNDEEYFEVAVVKDNTVTEPDIPTLEGNEFLGWFSDSSFNVAYNFANSVSGDLNLYAKWEVELYTVTFYYNEDEPEVFQIPYGEDIYEVYKMIDGIERLIIYLDSEFTLLIDFETMPSHDISIYGIINPSYSYRTISFNSNGGTDVDSIIMGEGWLLPDLPIPLKEGISFKGWYLLDGTLFDSTVMPDEDLVLYAVWHNNNITFGLIGPLTGPYSIYGTSVRDGAQLAVNEINAAGGVLGLELEIVAYDSQGDPILGVNAYNSLINEDNMDALIGGTFSGVTLAIRQLAIVEGIPVLTPTATYEAITIDADNMFRASYIDSYQGALIADFVANSTEIGASKVAVVYNYDDAYSTQLAMAFIEEYELYGTVVELLIYGSHDVDYSALLDIIAASDAEAVFLPGYVAEVGAILSQANNKGITIPFIGGDGWTGIEIDYAEAAEGNYYLAHYSPTDSLSIIQDFVTNYEAKYGITPNQLAALAYDAVYAMALAMENAGTVEYADVVAALANITMSESVTGLIEFDENGDAITSGTVIQIIDGEQVVIGKVSKQN